MARLGTRLSTLLLLALWATSGRPLSAQDLEPSLSHAAGALAGEVTRGLPGRGEAVEGLVVVPGRGATTRILGTVVRALLDDGFAVEVAGAPPRRSDRLAFRLEAGRAGHRTGRLVLESFEDSPWRIGRRFADADWVDAPRDDAIVVTGPFRRDREEALLAARRLAWQRVIARLELPDEDAPTSAMLDRLPVRSFFSEATADDGDPVYRCWFGVELGGPEEAAILRSTERRRDARRRAPWIRFGLGTGLGLVLLLGYLRSDLATRGYHTGRLRLAFGTLFLVGLVVCWRAPL